MNLGDFHTYVSSVVKMGSLADPFIPSATRQAALFLERNYTFHYMKVYEDSETISLGSNSYIMDSGTKSLHFARIPKDDGDFQYLDQQDPRNWEVPDTAMPEYFFWSGERTLRFNNTADQNYTLQLHRVAYTSWPTDLGAEPWLLTFAEDVMLAQTLLQLAVPLKDPDLFGSNRPFRDEALRSLINSMVDAESTAAEEPQMIYG